MTSRPDLTRERLARRWSAASSGVTFHNADTGFAVLKVKARGRRDLVTLVGHAPTIGAGEYIHAVGTWFTDRTHGLQFKADTLKTTPPTTAEGITRYLGSGMVRGIGPKLAERIVHLFGLETFEIIEADPARLEEVPGIGTYRAGRIAAGWAEQKVVRDIMVFLHGHGVSTSSGGAHFQDLRSRRHRRHDGGSLPARTRHPRHRLPERRRDRDATSASPRNRRNDCGPGSPTRCRPPPMKAIAPSRSRSSSASR